jgi:cation diffusion facilitator CzcD-associated flavoprotein CzcO
MSIDAGAPGSTSGSKADFEVVIIGAGFSGLLCAAYLTEAGIEDVRVFDMSTSVGGVWSNGGVGAYPGAACDVPAYVYLPFLDRTGYIPSRKYVSQPEISAYAEILTDRVGVRDKLRLSRKVIEVEYLGDRDALWRIRTVDAQTGSPADVVTCRYVITANGPLSTPRMPEISGMKRFKGQSFHTAQWERNASLTGKRVGVVGTGASAAQVITAIADDVATLHVFQRTATWCLRRDDQPTPPEMQERFRAGGYGEALRHIDWKVDRQPTDTGFTFDMLHDATQNAVICSGLKRLIRKDVPDRELAKRLTPDYPFFCKRPLFIDDYYTTFNKSHVTLVDDEGGVVGVDETGLTIARGEHYELDVIIYATGFDNGFIPFPILGRDGVSLADKFGASKASNYQPIRARTLWGVHVEEMPNLFMMIGPQSLNPVTNVTLLCEQQSIYIRDLILKMKAAGQSRVEPSRQAVEAWTERCDASAEGKVWLRCNNYYTKFTKSDAAAGRERASGMWMESFHEYLRYLLGAKGGTRDELLRFS